MKHYLVKGAVFVYNIEEKPEGGRDYVISHSRAAKHYEIDAENAREALRLAAVQALGGIAPAEDIHRDEEMSATRDGHGSFYTERHGQNHTFEAFAYVLAEEE